MHDDGLEFSTRLIHAGEVRIHGAVCLPVFQTAMYEVPPGVAYHDIPYIRLNNSPNHHALHEKLRSLENAGAALVTASGMAAITTTLLTVLRHGDHLLAQGGLYGGTHTFITEDFPQMGLLHDFIDPARPESWAALLRPTTRAIYVEAISNPLTRVGDLDAVLAFARDHNLTAIIDSTFATPVNYRPLAHGFDLCVHSATKYLNGHSDIVAGVVAGSKQWIERITHRLNHLGGCLDPHACFLLHRGLKTLALRVRQQNASALQVAQFLSNHPGIERVHYVGLVDHPDHARASRWMTGFGGVLSFEVKGDAASAQGFIERTRLPLRAPSLGSVESLITRPATTSHSGMTPEDRIGLGISDALIRLSVGIEDTKDLIDDLRQALEG